MVLHPLLRRESLLMIVAQEFVEKVERLGRDETLVLRRYKAGPGLLGVADQWFS